MSSLEHVKSSIIKGSVKFFPLLKKPANEPAYAIKFYPRHSFTFTANSVLENELNPLYKHVLKRWETRTDPLWYSFLCLKDAGEKKVVKVHLQRRVKAAFLKSLDKYGFARDGTWMKRPDNTPSVNPYPGKDLYGTAQFLINAKCLKTKFVDLQAQMDKSIEHMLFSVNKKNNTSYEKGTQAFQQKTPYERAMTRSSVPKKQWVIRKPGS